MGNDLGENVDKAYNFLIDSILCYQRLFDYSGDILSLLSLPYNLFQDVILKQIELRKKEMKKNSNNANNDAVKERFGIDLKKLPKQQRGFIRKRK